MYVCMYVYTKVYIYIYILKNCKYTHIYKLYMPPKENRYYVMKKCESTLREKNN